MSGYIKRWNTTEVCDQIYRMSITASDPNQDGFTTWPIKQDLYKIKWAVENALAKCPTYSVEDEFLEEHSKREVWKTLNEKTN